MGERRRNYTDWDDGVYGTGPTGPPKSRVGPIAVLLILVIFLCGVVTLLGVLNIKLFHQQQSSEEENPPALSFTVSETQPQQAQTEPAALDSSSAEESDSQDAVLDLQQAPQGVDNIPEEGGYSLQEIYQMNIDSVVSITCTLSSGTSSGTGVIFSQNGYIVTNAHVIDNALEISVLLTDGRGLLTDPKDESTLIPEIRMSDVPMLKKKGVISGGMIPKVEC